MCFSQRKKSLSWHQIKRRAVFCLLLLNNFCSWWFLLKPLNMSHTDSTECPVSVHLRVSRNVPTFPTVSFIFLQPPLDLCSCVWMKRRKGTGQLRITVDFSLKWKRWSWMNTSLPRLTQPGANLCLFTSLYWLCVHLSYLYVIFCITNAPLDIPF